MVNRELIRLKVTQLVYAYYQNEGKATDVALNELDFSLDKGYELYHYILSLLVEIRNYCERKDELFQQKEARTGVKEEEAAAYHHLATNLFLSQLAENKTLQDYQENTKKQWQEEEAHVKRLSTAFATSEQLATYLHEGNFNYEADRELVRKLYKAFLLEKDDFDSMLEEHSLYWNHDKDIIDSFVIKTIKRFDASKGAEQALLPQFSDLEDRLFAHQLFTHTIKKGEEIRRLIRDNCKNWEFSRLAFMDVVIMQIAMAEILSFPKIPLAVSINEYLNIAKMYSTPRSSSYINGLLDNICKKLRKEGVLLKERKMKAKPAAPSTSAKEEQPSEK